MSALDPRPLYFSQIRVDPANNQRVYLLEFALLVWTMRKKLSVKI